MARKSSPRKPSTIKLDACRVRAIRGPKGDGSRRWYWRAELSIPGASRSTIWTGWGTRDEARAEVSRRLSEQGFDTPGRGPQTTHDAPLTVRELLDAWLEAQESRAARGEIAESSFTVYVSTARRIGRSALGTARLDRLVAGRAIEAFVDAAVAEGRRPKGIKLDRVVLLAAWNWGVEEGHCPNSRLRFPRIRDVQPEKFTPTPDEWARVRAELPEGWAKEILTVQASIGCRIGALANLTRADVDLERREVTLTNKGKSRTIPYPPDAYAVLEPRTRKLHDPEARIFGEVSPQTIRTTPGCIYLKPACEAAGLPYFTPHGLRRMVETQMALGDVPIHTFAAYFGHSPAVALKAYSAVRSAHMRDALASAGIGGAQLADNVVPMRRRA